MSPNRVLSGRYFPILKRYDRYKFIFLSSSVTYAKADFLCTLSTMTTMMRDGNVVWNLEPRVTLGYIPQLVFQYSDIPFPLYNTGRENMHF